MAPIKRCEFFILGTASQTPAKSQWGNTELTYHTNVLAPLKMSKRPNKPSGRWEPPPLDWRKFEDPQKDSWRKPRKKKSNAKGPLR